MAFPTIPAFTYEDPAYIVTYADSTVLGQVKKVSGNTKGDRKKKEFPRLGDETITTARGAVSYESTAQVTLYESDDMADYLALVSQASGSGIDSTDTITLKVEVYDGPDASASLLYSWELANAWVNDAGFDADASSDNSNNTVNFTSDSKWIPTVAP